MVMEEASPGARSLAVEKLFLLLCFPLILLIGQRCCTVDVNDG